MAVTRATTNMIIKEFLNPPLFLSLKPKSSFPIFDVTTATFFNCRINFAGIRCAASDSSVSGGNKAPSRLAHVQQLMKEAEERSSVDEGPIPKITLDKVTVSFARSGGPGGQNVNKVNTKVDMRFNVKNARWLSERVREKILKMEKNRINKDGEIVITSTKTRTQEGNIEDALSKFQAIINDASYVPPPPSEEQKKKLLSLLLLVSKNECKARRFFRIKSNLEGVETVGTKSPSHQYIR